MAACPKYALSKKEAPKTSPFIRGAINALSFCIHTYLDNVLCVLIWSNCRFVNTALKLASGDLELKSQPSAHSDFGVEPRFLHMKMDISSSRQWNIIQCQKRKELLSHEKTWKNLTCIFLGERSQSEKGYILYDSTYMTSWKRQNYGESKKMSGCQGLWWGVGEGWRGRA